MTDESDANAPSSHLGYSVGRWEGNTLIIETDQVDYAFFNDQGIPQSDALSIVERFTLSENNTKLDWTATVTDPETFTEPVILPDFRIYSIGGGYPMYGSFDFPTIWCISTFGLWVISAVYFSNFIFFVLNHINTGYEVRIT